MNDPIIDVCQIEKRFHIPEPLLALNQVSCAVSPGEVVVIIGPSGSGKSTFLRCLNRLEYADAGQIVIDGVDILDPGCDINAIRAEVGMVFQSFNLFPHKTRSGFHAKNRSRFIQSATRWKGQIGRAHV